MILIIFVLLGSILLTFAVFKDTIAWFKDYKFLKQNKPYTITGQAEIEYGPYLNPVIVNTDNEVIRLKGALLLKGFMVGDNFKAQFSYLPYSKIIVSISIK